MTLEWVCGGLRRAPWLLVPGAWITALATLSWWLKDGEDVLAGLAITPALTCLLGGGRRRVLVSGALTLAVLAGEMTKDATVDTGPAIGAAVTMLAVLITGVCAATGRSRLTSELDRTREIALAAQQVLLRPLPHRIGEWTVAGEYVSASVGAHIGGDFYEVLATPFGVRALIGDARGHGLPAVGVVAALLGCFREAAHQEPELSGVLHRLDGALHRHLRDREPGACDPVTEEFATVQLIQLGADGTYQAVNCGHPQPYLLGPRPSPLPLGDPLPPLGLLEPAAPGAPGGPGGGPGGGPAAPAADRTAPVDLVRSRPGRPSAGSPRGRGCCSTPTVRRTPATAPAPSSRSPPP